MRQWNATRLNPVNDLSMWMFPSRPLQSAAWTVTFHCHRLQLHGQALVRASQSLSAECHTLFHCSSRLSTDLMSSHATSNDWKHPESDAAAAFANDSASVDDADHVSAEPAPSRAAAKPIGRYPCTYCDLRLATSSNRVRHTQRRHPQEWALHQRETRAFQCAMCSAGFGTRERLRQHTSSCSGELPRRAHAAGGVTRTGISLPVPAALSDERAADSQAPDPPSPASVERTGSGASASDGEPSWPPPALPLVSEAQAAALFAEFLEFLAAAPVTELEKTVKARRVTTPEQRAIVVGHLRCLCTILLQAGVASDPRDLRVAHFAQIGAAEALQRHLDRAGVRHERKYQLFLLLKKICVFLVNKQSAAARVYLVPDAVIPGWRAIDSLAHESCARRKQESANRGVGIQSQAPVPSFAEYQQRQTGASAEALSAPSRLTADVLTRDELARLTAACLECMEAAAAASSGGMSGARDAIGFAQCLVVCLLTMNATPRSQILRQLILSQDLLPLGLPSRIQTLFYDAEKDHFEVRIPAEWSKNRRPVLLCLNRRLTRHIRFFIDHLRRRLLGQPAEAAEPDRGFLFPARGGGSRSSFSPWTCEVTQRVLGRAVTPHGFRAACVSLYYGRSGTSERDMLVLSELMSHDRATAARYYFHTQRQEESRRVGEELCELLGVGAAPE